MAHRKYLLAISLLAAAASFTKPVRAEAFYSVASLTLLCGSENKRNEEACITYLHGIVETWMLKDVVSIQPYRFQKRGKGPAFCETINKVSNQEWLKIVRSNLNTMEPGFAADAVMTILSKKLCN